MARGPSEPAFHCLSAQFSPVMARGSSGPAYHCLLRNLPPLWRGPSSERALRRPPSYHLPFVSFAHLYGARPERASFSLLFLPNFPPLWCAAQAGQLITAFLCNLPLLWRVARPRRERSVGGPVIICLLFHLPTFMARGPSGPAFHCRFCQIFPRYGARPERASLSLPFCAICPRYGARPVLGAGVP